MNSNTSKIYYPYVYQIKICRIPKKMFMMYNLFVQSALSAPHLTNRENTFFLEYTTNTMF